MRPSAHQKQPMHLLRTCMQVGDWGSSEAINMLPAELQLSQCIPWLSAWAALYRVMETNLDCPLFCTSDDLFLAASDAKAKSSSPPPSSSLLLSPDSIQMSARHSSDDKKCMNEGHVFLSLAIIGCFHGKYDKSYVAHKWSTYINRHTKKKLKTISCA